MIKPVAHIATRLLVFLKTFQQSRVSLSVASLTSILFVETSRMGDVVSMLPLLSLLHDANPDAKLHVAVDERYVDILNCVPFVTTITGLRSTSSPIGFFRALRQLRQVKTDLAVSLSPSHRNAILTLSSRAPFKLGYFQSRTATTPYLYKTKVMSAGWMIEHPQFYHLETISERSLKIAGVFGLRLNGAPTVLSVPAAMMEEAERLLVKFEIRHQPFVVIHPFSGWEYRSWNLSNYFLVAEELARLNIHTVIIGSQAESVRVSGNAQLSNDKVHFLFGESLGGIIGLIKQSVLFVGNDSGPLHLATALGVRCVGLFGPASPKYTAPPSGQNVYFFEQVECSPCEQTICVIPANPCINRISSKKVIETILSLLHERGVVRK